MTIKYLEDIRFLGAGAYEDCKAIIDRTLDTFYAINLVESGELIFGQAQLPKRIYRGPFFFWTWPGPVWQYWSTGSRPWVHRWVSFSGPRAERIFDTELLTRLDYPCYALNSLQPMRAQFSKLIELIKAARPWEQYERIRLLEDLLVHLERFRIGQMAGVERQIRFRQLAERMRLEPFKDWNHQALAESLGLSYTHYRSLFKRELQLAPQQFVLRMRVQQMADELLAGQNVKQVAAKYGFSDLSNFARAFRSVMKVSPRQYLDSAPDPTR